MRKIKSQIIVLITLFICFCLLNSGYAATNKTTLVTKFDLVDVSINNGDGYSKSTNDQGVLAWAESYILESYLDMYEGTHDIKYLQKFVVHSDRIAANTDLNLKLKDYSGRSLFGWGSTRYSKNGERIVWLVHSGMITYPMARFANLVKANNLTAFQTQAQNCYNIAKTAMAVFDPNFIYDAASGKGYYQFAPDEPQSGVFAIQVPFNQQLAAGRTFLMLYKYNGDPTFFQKASALAKHFKSYLNKTSKGAYTWNYWYSDGYEKYKAVEDISHGAIDVDFAILAYRNHIQINKVDFTRFLQTFLDLKKNGGFADNVDGSGGGRYLSSIGRWLELSENSCTPYRIFNDILSGGTLPNTGEVMLGIAKLVKYNDRCKNF